MFFVFLVSLVPEPSAPCAGRGSGLGFLERKRLDRERICCRVVSPNTLLMPAEHLALTARVNVSDAVR